MKLGAIEHHLRVTALKRVDHIKVIQLKMSF